MTRTPVARLRRATQRRPKQLALPWPNTWGGARPGAGRRPGARPATPHRARPTQHAGEPVLVTLRARLAPLRSQHVFPTVRLALARASRRSPKRFRIAHFSVQHDHLHLVVEAKDKRALSSGMRSVAIRVAQYVNHLLGRRGPLWASRWHGRALASPREVRNALVYVLANFRKHARRPVRAGLDPFSSAAVFDGWLGWRRASGVAPPFAEPRRWRRDHEDDPERADGAGATFASQTWLGRAGWRRHGLVRLSETPRDGA